MTSPHPRLTRGSMRLTKAEREIVRQKFGGRCAYCGCDLPERWHADHMEPVIRGYWPGSATINPHNHRIDNMMPACQPCNISKGQMSLETWRQWIGGHVESLNSYHSIYRLAKAFGLVVETGAPVVFYFERVAAQSEAAE